VWSGGENARPSPHQPFWKTYAPPAKVVKYSQAVFSCHNPFSHVCSGRPIERAAIDRAWSGVQEGQMVVGEGPDGVLCQVDGQEHPRDDLIPAAILRPGIVATIRKRHPDFSLDGYICLNDLNSVRAEYVQDALEAERGDLTKLEKDVVRSMKRRELMARNVNAEFDKTLTLGARAADKVAEFGGSWRFISIFGAILLGWIVLNAVVLLNKGFDPYPFILLNLVLSCLASIQAPIIMMSQNRQSAKDRLQAEHDYQVNLKAELEIRGLHEKIDHLLQKQWQRLLEIQQVQTELVGELIRKGDKK
jgi:uncharacterized membrane protein